MSRRFRLHPDSAPVGNFRQKITLERPPANLVTPVEVISGAEPCECADLGIAWQWEDDAEMNADWSFVDCPDWVPYFLFVTGTICPGTTFRVVSATWEDDAESEGEYTFDPEWDIYEVANGVFEVDFYSAYSGVLTVVIGVTCAGSTEEVLLPTATIYILNAEGPKLKHFPEGWISITHLEGVAPVSNGGQTYTFVDEYIVAGDPDDQSAVVNNAVHSSSSNTRLTFSGLGPYIAQSPTVAFRVIPEPNMHIETRNGYTDPVGPIDRVYQIHGTEGNNWDGGGGATGTVTLADFYTSAGIKGGGTGQLNFTVQIKRTTPP